jgi:5-methylcytosine-specific restriction endonuclease McrA
VWLVETFRADVDVLTCCYPGGDVHLLILPLGRGVAACRCYRCGCLLTVATVTVDRIVPRCQGGTYRHTNIRPACGSCNSETGGRTRRKAMR